MEEFIDECEREHCQDEANNNKTPPVVPDGNDSDYTDLSDEDDDYGSEASTIKNAKSPRSPPCLKKKSSKKKQKKEKKRSKKGKKKNRNKEDSKVDGCAGAGALVVPNEDDEDEKTLTPEQASWSSAGDWDCFRTPDFICGMLHDPDGDFLYLIKWKDDGLEPTMDFILAAFVNQRWSELVVQFYDDLSERLLNGDWSVADYGNEFYFFLKYNTPDPPTNDDDADWTGGRK